MFGVRLVFICFVFSVWVFGNCGCIFFFFRVVVVILVFKGRCRFWREDRVEIMVSFD